MNDEPEHTGDKKRSVPRVSDAFSALRDIERSLTAFQKAYRPPKLALAQISPLYEQLAKSADVFRQSHISRVFEEQRRLAETIGAQVRSANLAFTGISSRIAEIENFGKKMQELSRPWHTSLFQISAQMQAQLRAGDLLAHRMAETMRFSIVAEAAFARFNGREFGNLLGVSAAVSRGISSTVTAVSSAYADLAKRLNAERSSILSVFPVVLDHPPLEVFNLVDLAQTVTEVEPEPEVESVQAEIRERSADVVPAALKNALVSVNPELRALWEGAKFALAKTNPDRPRQVATSLRELMTHILHLLSPDEEVKQWSAEPSYYHNGRPTRRARLLYICRGINHSEFTTFVRRDIDAVLAFVDLFQQGTHDIAPPFTDPQLKALLHRTEAAILFLVNISRSQ